MDKNAALTMLIFSVAEVARHSVAPTDSMEEHQCFFIDIFNNLVDSNLSKVSTDSKANPEFIKPKRQEMSYCNNNHICVYGSDYHFAKSLSCATRNALRGAECAYLPPHGNMAGDTRRRSCHSVWRRSLNHLR